MGINDKKLENDQLEKLIDSKDTIDFSSDIIGYPLPKAF